MKKLKNVNITKVNTEDSFIQFIDLYVFTSFQDFHSFILQCFLFYLHPCLMLVNYKIFLHFTFYIINEWHIRFSENL